MMTTHKKDAEVAERYAALLRADGYSPEIDEDGDVRFKYEGSNIIILLDDEDPSFVRVCLPNFLKIASDEHRSRVLAAVNEANRQVKVGKAFITKEHCWAAVEAFIPDAAYLGSFLKRYLRILQLLVKETIDPSRSR